MNEKLASEVSSQLTLDTKIASDLMTANPVSLREDATILEAVTLLTNRGISGVPVINEAGRPVGVLSCVDIVVHDRESGRQCTVSDYCERKGLDAGSEESFPSGLRGEQPDTIRVRDIMTPAVFSIAPDAPSRRVVEDMLALNVHRLFVVSPEGVLTGVISALDVLKHLRPE